MGNSYSEVIAWESGNWDKEHMLVYHNYIRRKQKDLVNNLSSPLRLCYRKHKVFDLEYEHWFITDKTWNIEFGYGDFHNAVVTIHNRPSPKPYVTYKEFSLESTIKDRIVTVLGASNYSLTLRNSEHVARYIQSGAWVSFQMSGTGVLNVVFKSDSTKFSKYVHQLPKELQPPKHIPEEIYPSEKYTDHLKYIRVKDTLTKEDNNNYNIIFLGPTGAGKSTLINLLYNKTVLVSDDTAASVTKEVSFTKGEYTFHTGQQLDKWTQSSKFNIIDTVGMCDSALSIHEVYNIVKDKVETNLMHIDKVVVVCSGRIEGNHVDAIKQFMKWLKYKQYKEQFVFFYNKADGQTSSKREINLQTMCEKLGVDTSKNVIRRVNSDGINQDVHMNCAIGFPPNADFESVKDDIDALVWGTISTNNKRIPISEESTCTIL